MCWWKKRVISALGRNIWWGQKIPQKIRFYILCPHYHIWAHFFSKVSDRISYFFLNICSPNLKGKVLPPQTCRALLAENKNLIFLQITTATIWKGTLPILCVFWICGGNKFEKRTENWRRVEIVVANIITKLIDFPSRGQPFNIVISKIFVGSNISYLFWIWSSKWLR